MKGGPSTQFRVLEVEAIFKEPYKVVIRPHLDSDFVLLLIIYVCLANT